MKRNAQFKMIKILTFFGLMVELIGALTLGVFSCAYGPNKPVIILSVFLLMASLSATVFLTISARGFTKIAVNIVFALIHLYLNWMFLGLVFGWEACPMV